MPDSSLVLMPISPGLGSQGRDLQLCMWELAEGRNAVVDSVRLESVGFCRSTVLADSTQRWTLAIPGRGSDEVSTFPPPPSPFTALSHLQ